MFQNAAGDIYEKRPVLPKGSASTGGNVTLIGAQIAKWEDVVYDIAAKASWHNIGYVNEGKRYAIQYTGGLWSANLTQNDGDLYDANGSDVTATQTGYPLVGAPEGALIGCIGNNPPFLIGNGTTTPEGQTGQFSMVINDDLQGEYGPGLKDNIGRVTMKVEEVS